MTKCSKKSHKIFISLLKESLSAQIWMKWTGRELGTSLVFNFGSHWPLNRPRPPTGLSKSLPLFFVSRFLPKKHWKSASNSKILTRDKDQHTLRCQLFRLTSLHKSNHFDKERFLSSDVTSFSIFKSTFFLEAQKQIIQHAYAVYWEIGNVERESACAP